MKTSTSSKRPEMRIVVRKTADGRREIFVHYPGSNKESHTGFMVKPAEVQMNVRKLLLIFEKAGYRVTVKELA